jgi:DNA repair protein RadC
MTKQAVCDPRIGFDVVRREDAVIARAAAILEKRTLRVGCLSEVADARQFLRMRLAGLTSEVFYVIYLDNKHRVLAAQAEFFGSISSANIHPRVIVRQALLHNAAAIICAHNHPSNDAEPSEADKAVTAHLRMAMKLVEVTLLDHFVVTVDECVSLAERGWV